MDRVVLACGAWRAEIDPQGAELKRLVWDGAELLWEGDPAWWARTAPILFPVVGATAGGLIRVDGRIHAMPKHGFARDLPWFLFERTEASATLRLADSDATRKAYPFAFRLDLTYALREDGLAMTARLHNPGANALPASFGFHPAFRWPLDPAHPREAHRVAFTPKDPGPLRRLDGDLLGGEAPSPVAEGRLVLRDDLFADDALIFATASPRELRYGVPGGRELILRHDLPHLGLWTKPGAPFLCLEPWQGYADPVGFSGPFEAKPGAVLLAPGKTRAWSCLILGARPSE